MATTVWTWGHARARKAGLAPLLALAVTACDGKNPLFLFPGKKEPPPGTANTPKQTPTAPASADPRHAAPPAD